MYNFSMFETHKPKSLRNKFLFGAVTAASIANGDLVFAQESDASPESITFSKLSDDEVRLLPVNDLLFEYAGNFYTTVEGGQWEPTFEKAMKEGLTGVNDIALVDKDGNAVIINEFTRHDSGECIISFKDFESHTTIATLYSKTPEICTVDGLIFSRQELMS